MVLETIKGQVLYVSEVQDGSLHNLKFNELPQQDSPITRIVLKIIAQIPKKTLMPSEDGDLVWCALKTYRIDLNKLQCINPEDIIDCYNSPMLEMSDGYYALPDVPVTSVTTNGSKETNHKRNASNYRVKQSFVFNSVLKLNKILDYISQVTDESLGTSDKLETLMQSSSTENKWFIESIKNSNQQLQSTIHKKKLEIKRLKEELILPRMATDTSLDSFDLSMNDYYGTTYPDLIQSRSRLEVIRSKKLSQLIGIFQATPLFDKELEFVEIDYSKSDLLYNKLMLKVIDKDRVMAMAAESDSNRDLMNTCLGYYLILVALIANKIYKIPLPYSLTYCGSTSIIENIHPLYLDDYPNKKHSEKFVKAIDYFDKDIVQIIQRLGHHRLP